jgi:hypothetical protein
LGGQERGVLSLRAADTEDCYFGAKDSFIHRDTTTPCPKLSSVHSL